MKYKCLKVTFRFPLTLDEVDFLGLLDQETELLFIITPDSISPSELFTSTSKRVMISPPPPFFTIFHFSLGLAPLGHLGHQFPRNIARGKLQSPRGN